MKTIFEELGGTYSQVGDYFLPDFSLPDEEEKDIILGRFGMAHKAWLKNNKHGIYTQLLFKASIFQHCKTVENRAGDMLETLMKQIANSEGITETLKATDQMAWVGATNNIWHRATEIVFREVIHNV